jgi:hypothetical protein
MPSVWRTFERNLARLIGTFKDVVKQRQRGPKLHAEIILSQTTGEHFRLKKNTTPFTINPKMSATLGLSIPAGD